MKSFKDRLNKLYRLCKNLRTDLLLIFVASLAYILIFDFLLINIPSIFDNADKIGSLIFNIAISYLTAFIFYFLVVHIKEENDKNKIYPYILNKVSVIVKSGSELFKRFSDGSKITYSTKFPSTEIVMEMCKNLHIKDQAPIITGGQYGTWMHFIKSTRNYNLQTIESIKSKMIYLEPELIVLIANIEENNLFSLVDVVIQTNNMVGGNQDLTIFHPGLMKYIENLSALDKYLGSNLVRYSCV